MSKHTPGPWFISDSVRPSVVVGNERVFVGTLNTDENIANARLISAAPELLSAIQFLIGASVPMSRQQSECWKALEAAIAKATGE